MDRATSRAGLIPSEEGALPQPQPHMAGSQRPEAPTPTTNTRHIFLASRARPVVIVTAIFLDTTSK